MLTEFRGKYPESSLLEYIEKGKIGEILVGRELMLQLNMLLEHFNNPAIKIDFTEAHKCIRFIQEKCKHF